MTVRSTAAVIVQDRRARRRALLVTIGAWLVFSLATGGGLVQYAPDGWVVPVGRWITYAQPTPYGFYAFDTHWAVVPVPLYLAQAAGVAALAGVYSLLTAIARPCRASSRRRRGAVGLVGTVTGVLGAAACCSPVALLLGTLFGGSLAAALTGVGLWAATGVFAVAVAVQLHRLRAAAHVDA